MVPSALQLVMGKGMADEKDLKQEEKWRDMLTQAQYHVMRERGTEPAFSGKYYPHKESGIYRCAACGAELFSSDAKYDSGTGWPSFTNPSRSGSIATLSDTSLGIERIEVVCPRCGSHLGHVFDDGPSAMPDGKAASGKRYCINSCALSFDKGSTAPSSGKKLSE